MPLSTECLVKRDNQLVKQSITEALETRERNRRLHTLDDIRYCVECSGRVVAHQESTDGAAHFEHHPWNFDCSLRHRAYDASRLERRLTKQKALTKPEAKSVMQSLIGKLENKGITFSDFIDRVQSLGIKLNELLERLITDIDGLISQVASG